MPPSPRPCAGRWWTSLPWWLPCRLRAQQPAAAAAAAVLAACRRTRQKRRQRQQPARPRSSISRRSCCHTLRRCGTTTATMSTRQGLPALLPFTGAPAPAAAALAASPGRLSIRPPRWPCSSQLRSHGHGAAWLLFFTPSPQHAPPPLPPTPPGNKPTKQTQSTHHPICHPNPPAGPVQPALPVLAAPAAAGAPQRELRQPGAARAAGGAGEPAGHGARRLLGQQLMGPLVELWSVLQCLRGARGARGVAPGRSACQPWRAPGTAGPLLAWAGRQPLSGPRHGRTRRAGCQRAHLQPAREHSLQPRPAAWTRLMPPCVPAVYLAALGPPISRHSPRCACPPHVAGSAAAGGAAGPGS